MRFPLLVGLAFFSSLASAAPVAAPGAFNTFMATATGVGQYTVGFGSGGVPMTSPGVSTIHTAGATPIATFTGMFPAASGRVAVTATAGISAAQTSAAVGRFLGRTLPVVSTGFALYELAKELGVPMLQNPDGTISYTKKKTTEGTQRLYFDRDGVLRDLATACGSFANFRWSAPYVTSGYTMIDENICQFKFYQPPTTAANGGTDTVFIRYSDEPAATVTTVPGTQQDFLDLIAAQSGWPSTSNIAKVLADAAAAEQAQATPEKPAVKIPVGTPTITGPATGPSTTNTTTRPSPTGTGIDTEKKTCTPQYVYALDIINTSEACVTTVTKPDGSTTTTETSTKPVVAAPAPATPSELLVCGLPNTPACKIDETGTPEVQEDTKYKPKIDDLKTKQDELKNKASGTDDKSFFANWTQFFVTPPFVACRPFVLPRDMGEIDACGVVDGVRTVMAFAWAVMAMVSSLAMIKKVV